MEFTFEEQTLLAPFVSNLDKSVFVLTNLPDVVKGALFARYSRTDKSLRRVLLDEFIKAPETGFSEIVGFQQDNGVSQIVAVKKAEEFYDRVLVGYGDDSVAELGGAHIACEDVSNVATKVLEDSRIGLSPLEKSTRYVYFDQKKDGRYKYYRDSEIMSSEFAEKYVQTCDLLFDTYVSLMEKIKRYEEERHPKDEGVSDRAYASTIRAKTCDVIRGLLPAATISNVGIFGNGRAFEYLITKMYAHQLREMADIASAMQAELSKTIPSFVKRASNEYGQKTVEYLKETQKQMEQHAPRDVRQGEWMELVDYDERAEEKIITAMLYAYTHLPMHELKQKVKNMTLEEKKRMVDAYLSKRANRRHKPGRALEQAYYTFDILADYGAYRDLQRHRMLSQERQDLTTAHGFETPKDIIDAGCEKEFVEAMQAADTTYNEIARKYPKQAQYVVPLQYRIRWYASMNAREVYHFTELRSARQGHPSYRKIAQEVYRLAREKHPLIFEHCKFVDMNDYELERLDAEKHFDKKMEAVRKKYGEKNEGG